MSYKEEIRQLIESLESENTNFENRIVETVHTLYFKALNESKKTGLSVESITYEMLEGIEEALEHLNHTRTQKLLHDISETIAEVIHSCAQENISHKYRNVQLAKEKLQDTIEMEKAHLAESMDAFRAYAKDHQHDDFAESLEILKERMQQMKQTLTDKIEKKEE